MNPALHAQGPLPLTACVSWIELPIMRQLELPLLRCIAVAATNLADRCSPPLRDAGMRRARWFAAMTVNAHVARRSTILTNDAARDDLESSREGAFGEYLVNQGLLDRFQLFRALQLQDRLRGARIGECVAALGYAPIACVEKIHSGFAQLQLIAA